MRNFGFNPPLPSIPYAPIQPSPRPKKSVKPGSFFPSPPGFILPPHPPPLLGPPAPPPPPSRKLGVDNRLAKLLVSNTISRARGQGDPVSAADLGLLVHREIEFAIKSHLGSAPQASAPSPGSLPLPLPNSVPFLPRRSHRPVSPTDSDGGTPEPEKYINMQRTNHGMGGLPPPMAANEVMLGPTPPPPPLVAPTLMKHRPVPRDKKRQREDQSSDDTIGDKKRVRLAGKPSKKDVDSGPNGIAADKAGRTKSKSAPRRSARTPRKKDKDEPIIAGPPSYCLFYRVSCPNRFAHSNSAPLWQDLPYREPDEAALSFRHLFGKNPIFGFDAEMADEDIAFVIFRRLSCTTGMVKNEDLFGHGLRPKSMAKGTPYQETMLIVSKDLQAAINSVTSYDHDSNRSLGVMNDPSHSKNEMDAPYLFLVHHREKLNGLLNSDDCSDRAKEHVGCLLDYLNEEYGEIFDDFDELLKQGKTRADYLDMIYQPNEVMITTEDGYDSACVLRAWPNPGVILSLHCWSWKMENNRLTRDYVTENVLRPAEEVFDIRSLSLYPAKYAPQELRDKLSARGKRFWDYRGSHYVSYTGMSSSKDQYFKPETRFMIDYAIYSRLHRNNYAVPPQPPVPWDPWPLTIELSDEVEDRNFALMPAQIDAFYLKEKEWKSLLVENITSITWNKEAFDRLVLPSKTKDLIKALVMVRTSEQGAKQGLRLAGKRDDIIAGKGNGLILLLHGGPGTGKTLTAESVAEIAEMPLYSVTCGDIGTNAEDVEKYLQTIMFLGKAWNCVLLLDEADIFLEERTLSDIERNSIVSVFLRILEYYDGILILTSNRVGTFDEAFKSRIQVALHYPPLDLPSRKKIWQNFFNMFSEDEVDVNLDEISRHLDELADHEMNGRQIRNVLTTARQLALFKKETLEWEHIEQSIKTAQDFNRYLRRVQGHSDEQWAREEKLR